MNAVCGEKHRPVTDDGRLGRERIHRLLACAPWIDSIANATPPRPRSRAIPSTSVSGSRKPMTTVPDAIEAVSVV